MKDYLDLLKVLIAYLVSVVVLFGIGYYLLS
jgi:hypothetical protein